jgi:toxin CptA
VYTLMREIELKPSRQLGLLLAGMLLLALLAVSRAALPAGLQMALGAAALALGGWGWRRAAPRANLRIAAGGRLQYRDDAGAWRDAGIQGDSFVSAALIVLRYRTAEGALRSLTLLPDSAAADDLRRLRVLLRWTSRTRSDTSAPGAG